MEEDASKYKKVSRLAYGKVVIDVVNNVNNAIDNVINVINNIVYRNIMIFEAVCSATYRDFVVNIMKNVIKVHRNYLH